jgi:hypothetical protein
MVQRFLKIQTQLSGVVELLSLLPNHLKLACLTNAFESLKKFDSVTLMLQREGMSFVESREIFDLFLKDFPAFAYYIGEDALIVENELFEKAVMRIARSLPLSEEQEALVVSLIKEESPPVEEPVEATSSTSKEHGAHNNEDEISYSEELQQKLKRQRTEVQADKAKSYINLDALPGTSVNCERLFSAAKFILSDTRKRTSPKLFEALLLLKVNRNYWNIYSVGKAMGKMGEGDDIDTEDTLDMQNDCLAKSSIEIN